MSEPVPGLTRKQERIWARAREDPAAVDTLISATHRIHGELSVERLAAAFRTVLEWQEHLRLMIRQTGDDVQVRVRPAPAVFPIPVVDLRYVPADGRAAAAAVCGDREARRPILLDRDLPVRATLVRLTDDSYELLTTVHHIACDGVSLHLLLAQVHDVYTRGDLALPPRGRTFAEVSRSERPNDAPMTDTERRWWAGYLAGLESPDDTDRGGSMDAVTVHETLEVDLVARLQTAERSFGCSPYTFVVAAAFMALYATTGVADRALWIPFGGDRFPDHEHTVGMFATRLPVRLRIGQTTSVTAIVDDVRAQLADLLAHCGPTHWEVLAAAGLDPGVIPPLYPQLEIPEDMGLSEPGGIRIEFAAYRVSQVYYDTMIYLVRRPESTEIMQIFRTSVLGFDGAARLRAAFVEALLRIGRAAGASSAAP